MTQTPEFSLVCASTIDTVVVYARGALVTRIIDLPDSLSASAGELVLEDISPATEAGSFRTEFEGRRVIGVRSELVIPELAGDPGPALRRVRELGQKLARLTELRSALFARHRVLEAISLVPKDRRRLRWLKPDSRVADAIATAALIDQLVEGIDDRGLNLGVEIDEIRKRLAEAQVEADQATSVERAHEGHPSRRVSIQLSPSDEPLERAQVTYTVPAARWWPVYTARLTDAGREAEFSVEAFVAQSSFEDWSNVKLSVCTADLNRHLDLPDLPSQRIGRAQTVRPSGYRPAPEGLSALFDGFDRFVAERRIELSADRTTRGRSVDVLAPPIRKPEERLARDKAKRPVEAAASADAHFPAQSPGVPPPNRTLSLGAPPPATMGPVAGNMPLAQPQSVARKSSGGLVGSVLRSGLAPIGAMAKVSNAVFGSSSAASEDESLDDLVSRGPSDQPVEAVLEPETGWLDFDNLALTKGESAAGSERWSLGPKMNQFAQPKAQDLGQAQPERAVDPRTSRGAFDHRYSAAGRCDVPSNAQSHRVTLSTTDCEPRLALRVVPRLTTDVFREVAIDNPIGAPVLRGPIDVLLDGALVTTHYLAENVDRGGVLRFGLGQEQRITVARNVRVEEGSRGLLGGTLEVDHHITVDLSSALGFETVVEVVDRLPITDHDDVDIEMVEASPPAESYSQEERNAPLEGGRRWRVTLKPGESRVVEHTYRVSLPNKLEVVGGNRRD